jgi:hypothetical protein
LIASTSKDDALPVGHTFFDENFLASLLCNSFFSFALFAADR